MTLDPSNQYAPKLPVTPKGDIDDTDAPNEICSEGPGYTGRWKYRHLRASILGQPTSFQHFWDNTTLTPWLFDRSTATFISYDDPTSIRAKANYINKMKLRGAMVWDLGGTRKPPQPTLSIPHALPSEAYQNYYRNGYSNPWSISKATPILSIPHPLPSEAYPNRHLNCIPFPILKAITRPLHPRHGTVRHPR
ncbi:hypothetical protein L0F63_000337 [Massospora cicadina]|nr:hypothetical protein L0F63_000337 [Massospora cicadina]